MHIRTPQINYLNKKLMMRHQSDFLYILGKTTLLNSLIKSLTFMSCKAFEMEFIEKVTFSIVI